MKLKVMTLKHFLAVICILALFVSIVPSSAFAADVDLEAIYRQVAEAQAQAQAQAQQMQEAYAAAQAHAQQVMEAAQQFDVEAAFKHLSSLKTGEEKEAFFNSLTEVQQKLLVEYVKKLIEEDKFHGFDDFDFPTDLLPVSEEKSVAEEAENEGIADETEPESVIETEAEAAPVEEKSSDSVLPAEETSKEEAKTEESSEEKKGFFGGFIDFLFGKSSSEEEDPAVEEASEEPVEAPADEVTEDPADEVTEEPVEAPADEVTEEPTEAPAAEVAEETAEAPADEITEKPVETPSEEVIEEPAEPEIPVLTEEQMFYNDYEHYINLYKEFGSYADLSGVSYDVQQRIKALVDAPSADEVTEDADAAALVETEMGSVIDEASALPEDGSEESAESEETEETSFAEDAELLTESIAAELEGVAENLEAVLNPDLGVQVPDATPVSVSITSSRTDTMALGEPVVLTAVLDDAAAEYSDIIYVWEVDKGTGVYEAVPDAEGPTYTFPASADTLRWNWRLSVFYR